MQSLKVHDMQLLKIVFIDFMENELSNQSYSQKNQSIIDYNNGNQRWEETTHK